MNKTRLTLACAIALALAGCGGGSSSHHSTTLAVIGDMPYGTAPDDTSEFDANPAFISAINADPDVSMVLHAGDIHSGKQYCTEAYDVSIASQWKAFADPLIYTPGDNEWADCHKKKEGGGAYNATTGAIDYVTDASGNWVDYAGGDPVANLDLVRSIFFADAGKDFSGAMSVHTQAKEYDAAHPSDSNYVENVWFEKTDVLFVSVNIPGGSNNGTDPWYGAPSMSPAQAQEVANRTGAALRWLDTAFAQAEANGNKAVVILTQADMWDLDGNSADHIAEYKQYIEKIAALTTSFGKPVLLINGDSHIFRSDNPLQQGATCVMDPDSGATATACTEDAYASHPDGYNVANFHRIVVHGSTTPFEYLKLHIDTKVDAAADSYAFGPFSWSRVQP